MCLLAFKPANSILPIDHVEGAVDNNPHGIGLAVAYPDAPNRGVSIRRWLAKDLPAAVRAVQASQHLPLLFHARFATHGPESIKNCHPFPIGQGAAFAHNGILTGYGNPGLSDTVDFIRRVVRPMARDNPNTFRRQGAGSVLLDHFARAEQSRFGILFPDGECSIANEASGDWVDGVWYSNDSYETYFPRLGYSLAATPTYFDEGLLDRLATKFGSHLHALSDKASTNQQCEVCQRRNAYRTVTTIHDIEWYLCHECGNDLISKVWELTESKEL